MTIKYADYADTPDAGPPFHRDVPGEIISLTEVVASGGDGYEGIGTAPTPRIYPDALIIEDAGDGNAKRKVSASDFPAPRGYLAYLGGLVAGQAVSFVLLSDHSVRGARANDAATAPFDGVATNDAVLNQPVGVRANGHFLPPRFKKGPPGSGETRFTFRPTRRAPTRMSRRRRRGSS